MSSGITDLIAAIENSVGLTDGDTHDELSLDNDYAATCGADAINKLQARIKQLEENAVEQSWINNPDRMGGAFTDEEIIVDERW